MRRDLAAKGETLNMAAKVARDENKPNAQVAENEVPCGAIWRRVDLHLHSPGIEGFRYPQGGDPRTDSAKRKTVEAYVCQLRESKIEIGAITDYNGIRREWFAPIREEARKYGITIFPGAELSFRAGKHGLHILAVFEENTDVDQVNSFLLGLDRDPATPLFDAAGKHRDTDSKDHIADALNSLRQRFGCLLIPPHPDQENGLCKSFQPSDAAKLLKEMAPDAIEHCPVAETRKLQSTGALDRKFFERLACVEFSDPKRIEEIGTKVRVDRIPRATYLKLSAVHLDALRLALHDPETRVRIGSVPASVHARVKRLVVSGSGFLGNQVINWNDDLNVIIGGRGVGKSAIIETLRYGLAMQSYADQSYREELVRHALGSGGKVEVFLERPLGDGNTERYLVTRVRGEEPRVLDLDSDKLLPIDPSALLGPNGGPTIFGQREIYAVSQSEEYRLALLDELIGDEARKHADSVRQAVEQLRVNARSITDIRKRLAKRDEYIQRLKTLEQEISVYEKHRAAEKLGEATRLSADGQRLKGAGDAVSRVEKRWTEFKQEALTPLETAKRDLSRGQSQQKSILDDAAKLLDKLHTDLNGVLREGESLLSNAKEAMNKVNSRWREILRPLEDEINRIKQEAQTDVLDPDRLLKLTEERTGLTPLIEELNRDKAQLKEFQEKREDLLRQVRDRRHTEHQLRQKRADTISKLLRERLQLEVEFKGQKQDYKKRLGSLLKGSGVSEDAINKLISPEATDGIALAEAVQVGSEEVVKRFGLTSPMADRLGKWLNTDQSRLFELQTFIPHDSLQIKLRVDEQYRSLEVLSVGQRATAVLLLLFALEGRVLVLDQPEDDLDNRFVYEDVVQILREQKGLTDQKKRRQVIAATHNANIPVIGDAELVLALDVRENRAAVIGRASIDDLSIRELIKEIMEGGEEAFFRRAMKYGGLRVPA